ncbi:sulfurtransferase [Psychroflexus halocasei]|uniref:Thiosulfate/3-mercaptopyruvate sulfurtransferase n=1 Tax=Psychroflexus halocasei TaxID=908615 RepID=A0A1H4DTA9_9FLAO|nr:sulfurtransferase [Psychroflexus halocasei]SEA76003.1 thiosulfate/3-mercaptopyruvate sulfurtransferase [Psychroflexus halocasei]
MSQNTINPLISVEELKTIQSQNNLIIADVRFGETAHQAYLEKHLQNSIFVDLENDLSAQDKNFSQGGRHPLPKLEDFSKTLGQLGIQPSSHVVIYDDKNGALAAARFWWMLKAVGHEKVQVLNGGLQAAENADFEMQKGEKHLDTVQDYPLTSWQLPLADISEVEKATENENINIVDIRGEKRYSGEIEPIDPIAGHIPTAINIPFQENLNEEGLFLSPDKLRELYQEKLPTIESSKLIFHCGSGVSACHFILAMSTAGLEIPKLYVGSWGEWSRKMLQG